MRSLSRSIQELDFWTLCYLLSFPTPKHPMSLEFIYGTFQDYSSTSTKGRIRNITSMALI